MAIGEGDEIVLSIMEHHSNIVPWNFHRERKGAVIKWAPIADDGTFLLDEFEKLLTDRTKIVAADPHVERHRHGGADQGRSAASPMPAASRCWSTAARARCTLPVDVQDLDCDFYCFTGHKLYGPTGIGVLYGKSEHLKAMPPYMGGGEMIAEVTEDGVTYAEPPHRFEAGTPPIVQAIGLGAALTYMEGIGRERIAAHEASLRDYAMERLSRINSLTLYGTTKDKGAIVSFNMAGAHPHDISTIIDRSGVAVRAGTHCAQPLLARYGTTATCRASFGMYNTLAEVDALAEALQKAHEFFA